MQKGAFSPVLVHKVCKPITSPLLSTLCVCLCALIFPFHDDTSLTGLGHLNDISLVASANIPFPNKATSWGTGGSDFNTPIRGRHNPTHSSPALYSTLPDLYDQQRLEQLTKDHQTRALSKLLLPWKTAYLGEKSLGQKRPQQYLSISFGETHTPRGLESWCDIVSGPFTIIVSFLRRDSIYLQFS